MYFVMLNHPSENIPAIPMVDDNNNTIFFDELELAQKSAEQSFLGDCYGFEVFELGNGC